MLSNGRDSNSALSGQQTRYSATKLRTSCDACALSKVRCGKDQPACARCVATNVSCVYGISQKFGRAPRTRAYRDRNSSLDRVLTPSSQASCSETIMHRGKQHQPMLDTELVSSGACHSDAGSPFSNRATPFVPPMSFSPFPMDSVHDAAITPLLQHFQGCDNSQEHSPVISKSRDQYPIENWNNASDLLFLPDCAESITPSYYGSSSGFSIPSYQSSFDSQSPAKRSSHESVRGEHHCYTLARSTLDLLQQQHQPAGSNPPTVDHTLRNNRSATAKVLQILDCSCARDPHLALLSATIVSKILTWYQDIGGLGLGYPKHQQQPFDRQNRSNSHCSVRPNSSLSASSLPISIGEFTLDSADQELLSQQIVLGEARKAGALVERMAAMQDEIEGSNEDGGGGGSAVGNLYALLAVWLQGELSRTTREMKEQVRRAVRKGP